MQYIPWNMPFCGDFFFVVILSVIVDKFLCLTHLPLVPNICLSESGQHWFRLWLVAYWMPSHFLNQCWVIVNWTLGNHLQLNFNQNTKIFIHENVCENIICEMVAILFRERWVNICMFFRGSANYMGKKINHKKTQKTWFMCMIFGIYFKQLVWSLLH